jgi:hypothetical protein
MIYNSLTTFKLIKRSKLICSYRNRHIIVSQIIVGEGFVFVINAKEILLSKERHKTPVTPPAGVSVAI